MNARVGMKVAEDRRGVLLRVLVEQSHTLNDGVLQDALEALGHAVSRDVVRADMQWLSEQGLLEVERVGSLWLGTVTQRGDDVASGRSNVPGVKRPGPRA